MLSLLLVLMLQSPAQLACEEAGGYFKIAGGGTCLTANDMDSDQFLLFSELRAAKRELAQALLTQQEFNAGNIIARKSNYDALIAAAEAKRNATSGRPAQAFQDRIDELTVSRDRLDFTCANEPDPLLCEAERIEVSPRDKAGQLGPVVSQLNQDISDLKRDLNASIP